MPTIAALKRSINTVCDEFLSLSMCSSLSSGTLLKLVEGGFLPSTNNLQTIFASSNVLNYKPAKLYLGSAKKANKPDLSRQWFVYYSYRNPATGKLERQPPIYRDINTYNTIGERKEYGQALIIIINDLLKAGFSPYEEFVSREDGTLNKNILSCAEFYLAEKKKYLAKKSYTPYSQHVGWFVDWIKETHLTHLNIDQVKRHHIMKFLSDYRERSEKYAAEKGLKKAASNRQINNIKDNISGFFNYFKTNFEDDVTKNPVKGIADLPHKTQGNKAFTDRQMTLLKSLMLEHNARILTFCEMVYESCTRPHEETRLLKVMDLEFDQNRIHIRPELSKEGRSEYIPIGVRYMNWLKKYTHGYAESDYLFSINRHLGANKYNRIKPGPLVPGEEPISEWTLRTWFKAIKDLAGLDETWSIYSFKHSYCVRAYLDTKDVYFIQIKCRHTDLATTCKYLRNLGLFVDLNQIADNVRGI
ncbi:MAG: Site-specific recombinase XerD [Mucilaginibacter sp.]|nr:Site-specific recombinase XerD [Mucilaginibacter sp.]